MSAKLASSEIQSDGAFCSTFKDSQYPAPAKRLAMERTLAVAAAIGLLVVFGRVTTHPLVENTVDHDTSAERTCLTPKCYETATRISANLDLEVNPCDNFYEFACGGYLKTAPVPEGKINIDPFATVAAKIEEELKAILEEASRPGELRPFTLAKNLYRTCTNTTRLEELGLQPLHEILDQFGKWPVLEGENWDENNFDWIRSVHTCRRYGYSTDFFMQLSMGPDWKNSSNYVLMLGQPSFGLSREALTHGLGTRMVQAYHNYMIDVAVLLGADKELATRDLEESLQFEINMTKISLPSEEKRNFSILYNPMTVGQLNAQYPSINWEEYANNILQPSVEIDADEVVVVSEPNYIGDLETLIRNTPKRVLANYVGWRVVLESTQYVTESLREREIQYNYVVSGVKPDSTPRWKDCLTIVGKTSLSLATNALYVRKHFKEEARQSVVELVNDITNQLMRILREADWMDERTRSRAMDKVTAMPSHVAYPFELLDDKILAEFYSALELTSNDFLPNIKKVAGFDQKVVFDKLKKPINKTEWITHEESTEVNAFYSPNDNSIQIPAGILREPFFNNDVPRYMNYGAIGYLIGHEVTHSFDAEGRQFDKDGNLIDWWTPETAQKFMDKAQCIINQYSNYTVPAVGLNVDGAMTVSENIADNGGLKEAYYAYKEYVKRNGPEPGLPNLDYTPEQMFWISNANVWCSRFRPEAKKYELIIDEHSPYRFRVIGSVSNIPEFAADFNCPVGSNMNPVHKCSVV